MDVAFANAERAAQNFGRLQSVLPAEVFALLPGLLAEAPDPDAALNLLERLCIGAMGEGQNEQVLRLFAKHPFLAHYAIAVFGYSQYLGETLIQNPDLFQSLAREKNLEHSYSPEDYQERLQKFLSRQAQTDASLLLARFRKREYVRIMLRDVLGIATLAETTAEISALAGVLIAHALQECEAVMRERFGSPQVSTAEGRSVPAVLAVLSLGKLGGNELNYNSDVDLLFIFSDGEAVAGAKLPLREYFIRLAQQVTEMLSRTTAEGAVFRIDLRLRPQGGEGEPAVPLGRALRYYAEAAHDWELQALIKARFAAGDANLARQFIRGVQSRVYRGGLNFPAIETALNSAQKIRTHRNVSSARRHAAQSVDVKVDRGGIRDVEFLVQCLQRVYGGDEAWLRSSGTLFSLQKLHDKRHISGKDFHDLTQAYEFLRRVEHRLQLRHGQQTHRLPSAAADLQILARSLEGAQAESRERDPELFLQKLGRHMERVSEIYERLVHAQKTIEQQVTAQKEFALAPAISSEAARDGSYEQILQRLAIDSPALYRIAARRDLSARARRYMHRLLSSALTRSDWYGAIVRSHSAVEKALNIFESSDFLSEMLIRHPDEILVVNETTPALTTAREPQKTLELSSTPAPVADATLSFAASIEAGYYEKMALLRRNFRHRVFELGVRDLLQPLSIAESLEAMTVLADSTIAAALQIALAQHFSHGVPPEFEFALLGLGRLGTREFDTSSDADLIFIRSEETHPEDATKVAGLVVEILAAYTQEGTIFPVDTRLRPMGNEGELVTTPAALRAYFDLGGEAQAWEALTFTKLRPIAGSVLLARRAAVAVRTPAERFGAAAGFLPRVLAMRDRISQAQNSQANFKTDAGGFYDIDFICGYLLVKHRPPFSGCTTRERLHALAAAGLISDGDCATLDYAAELMRATDHAIRLVSGRGRATLPANEHALAMIEKITKRLIGSDLTTGLEGELSRTAAEVRKIFNRLLRQDHDKIDA